MECGRGDETASDRFECDSYTVEIKSAGSGVRCQNERFCFGRVTRLSELGTWRVDFQRCLGREKKKRKEKRKSSRSRGIEYISA